MKHFVRGIIKCDDRKLSNGYLIIKHLIQKVNN